jgi:hypothetical protein
MLTRIRRQIPRTARKRSQVPLPVLPIRSGMMTPSVPVGAIVPSVWATFSRPVR